MNIPKDVILIHLGSNASIPTGWVRETGLDGKFTKGAGDSIAPNQTGGAATHTHASPTHTHQITAHTHTYTLSAIGDDYPSSQAGGSPKQDGEHNHSHGTATSGARADGTSGTTAVTYSAVSNNPPNRKVIFIKSNGGKLETDMAALWIESDTAPTNWSKVTELADRYLLGASTGADADLTTDGGSTVNAHTYNHSHTANNHTHANGTSAQSSVRVGNDGRSNGGGSAVVDYNHSHTVGLGNQATSVTDYSGTPSTQSETVEPAYQRLHLIKKAASGLKEKGIIGMWLGSIATIPAGWILVASMKDKHCKIGNPVSSGTGGSNTHTHAAQGHVHSSGAHTHTGTVSAHAIGRNDSGGSGDGRMIAGKAEHTIENVQSQSPGYDSTNITANSSNNEPEYRTVAFIKFQTEMGGGPLLLSLMR